MTIRDLLILERKQLTVLKQTYMQYLDFISARIQEIDKMVKDG